MAELITVPSFVFNQGKIGDTDFEKPIVVSFYNGEISLSQQGEFEQDESISIHPHFVKKLLREITKHQPDAQYWLDNQ